MLRNADVNRVLIQAEYQSGDRYTIASALKVDPHLGIMILHRRNADGTARELQRLYSGVENADKRIVLVPVPPKEASARNLRKYRGQDLAMVAVKQHYTNATQTNFIETYRPKTDPARRKQNFVFDTLNLIEDGIRLQRVSGGTYAIGGAFEDAGDMAGALQKGLQQFWALDAELPVRLWLNRKGFSPNKRYVFLFAKKGRAQDEKAHHFTSILTWRLLVDKIRAETDIIPVLVGDDIGIKTSPSLVKFWEDQGWKDAFNGSPTRRDQLGLWAYFAKTMGSCSILGMRSGMIEVPALMGIRTRYVEERENGQQERMASWLGKVPGWSRQIVERTPGIIQQKYMAGYRHTRPATAQETAQADAVSYKLNKAELGVGFDQAELKRKINAVFGDQPLAGETSIDPKQFMIRPEEFDEIIDWIKDAPAGGPRNNDREPEPRTDIAMGRATEDAMADMRARTAIRDWSNFP